MHKAFSLFEVLIVVALLAVLALVTYVVINPMDRINQGKDTTRQQDVQVIMDRVFEYALDHQGEFPTHSGGESLPVVTTDKVIGNGISATSLDGIVGIPLDPDGVEYKLGVTETGVLVVATTLSDGTIFAKTK